jgi:hypothetical protein
VKPLKTLRDVIITKYGGELLVTATDSCGAIGEKTHDIVTAAADIAGEFTARVALLEVLCTGAQPAFVSVPISNEPKTAETILAGVRRAFSDYTDIQMVISTEKNMATSMTAFGVSVTGICSTKDFYVGKARAGDLLFCAGLPLLGGETLEKGAPLFTPAQLKKLTACPAVHAVIPCGSRGAAAECEIIASESGLAAVFGESGIDLKKSAGPASCAVFAAKAAAGIDFGLDIPIFSIGSLM